MAASKKTGSTRKPAAKKKNNRNRQSNQFWSIVLFALGVFVLLVTIIEGESAWNGIHSFILGLFGVSAYIVPVILIYVSIMIALDRSNQAVAGKLIQGIILMLLVSGLVHIFFVGSVSGEDFLEKLVNLYKQGTNLDGGGLFSAVLGWPLLALFKKTGASIVICLLLFVFIMLLTNFTIVDFLGLFYKPFRKMKDAVDQAKEEEFKPSPGAKRFTPQTNAKGVKTPPNEPMPPKEKRKKFDNIDIPIPGLTKEEEKPAEPELPENIVPEGEPLPMHPVISPKITKDKLEETAKNADPELESIIKKAVDSAEERNPSGEKSESLPVVEPDGQTRLYEKDNQVSVYKYPPIALLNAPPALVSGGEAESELKMNADTLVDTLKSFGVQTRIVDIHRGPTVTRYELQPSAGVKISKITGLSDDIALNLAAAGVRIEAPIPGKAAVGIEVPNKNKDTVTLRELLESPEFENSKSKLSFALGKDIEGKVVIGDIAKMPHVIIAGTTGSGKSVCTNSIIMSILFHASPDEVRLVLIDPKMVEFKTYDGIPHLLIPVVTDPRKAAGALNWAVNEMLKRYRLFADNNVRDLKGYNEMARETEGVDPLPQIVIAIDELADLMMAASNEVEDAICRLAQMARAAGMHLIIATQRPTVDVITGLIKANIPSRIALTVSSQVDSRTIIDVAGAEKLLGYGDMLYYPSGIPKPVRVQGCFCSTKEVEAVVAYIKNEIKADYDQEIMDEIEKNVPVPKGEGGGVSADSDGADELIEQAIECVVEAGQASTSYIQRRLKVGYARAGRIIDELEEMGIVGPFEGSKPRTVLMTKEQLYQRKLQQQ